jgi:hypothetical protein
MMIHVTVEWNKSGRKRKKELVCGIFPLRREYLRGFIACQMWFCHWRVLPCQGGYGRNFEFEFFTRLFTWDPHVYISICVRALTRSLQCPDLHYHHDCAPVVGTAGTQPCASGVMAYGGGGGGGE